LRWPICGVVGWKAPRSSYHESRSRLRGRQRLRGAHVMSPQETQVLGALANLGIAYERFEHPPVATVAEAEAHWKDIDAAHCKNLFLRNQKGDRHYLVILAHSKRADLRRVADQVGDGKLSFASPERLMKYLGITPGSVSPFGLLNDAGRHVRVYVDRDVLQATRITFHPNDNMVTLVVSVADFERFLQHVGNVVRLIAV
jgi:Ala-tRNA(Pro) deacylase